jgi:hypothetical protein
MGSQSGRSPGAIPSGILGTCGKKLAGAYEFRRCRSRRLLDRRGDILGILAVVLSALVLMVEILR